MLCRRNLLCGIALGVLVLLVPPAPAWAELPFFDFNGYSYLSGPPGQVGTVVNVAAKFNVIQPNPSWPVDLQGNEYTVMIQKLRIAAVNSHPPFQEITYSGGTIGLYIDPAKDASWDPSPPNRSMPSTFLDGDAALIGSITDMVLFYNADSGTGTVTGLVTWEGGAKRDLLGNPVGWTFFGMVSHESGLEIPAGYDLAWDPQLYGPERPSPVVPISWGGLKYTFHK